MLVNKQFISQINLAQCSRNNF